MKKKQTDIEKTYYYWLNASDQDYNTMNNLYKTKDYHWSLSIGHLVIEKLLKAGVVKATSEHAPFTHDLRRLSILSNIKFNDDHLDWLDTITTFNINARYDSYKKAFYKKCTRVYTNKWLTIIKDLREWIKKRL